MEPGIVRLSDMTIHRLLMIRGGAVGDFIVTLPVIGALRQAFPQAWIEVLGRPSRARLADHPRYANRVTDLESLDVYRLFQPDATVSPTLADYLRSFDLIIAYLPLGDGTLMQQLRRYTSGEIIVWSPHPPAGVHITDHLLQALASLQLHEVERQPRIEIDGQAEIAADAFWCDANLPARGAIAFHPGSGSPDKLWPLEGWGEVMQWARQLGIDSIIIRGPAEEERDLALLRERTMPHWPWVEAWSLPDLAALLKRCQIVVSHDSGIAHLAAAVEATTLALFGPTDPQRWGPRSPRTCVLQPAVAQPLTLHSLPPTMVIQTLEALRNGTFAWQPSSASYTIRQH